MGRGRTAREVAGKVEEEARMRAAARYSKRGGRRSFMARRPWLASG